MIADDRRRGGRHSRARVASGRTRSKFASWRRVAAALIGLGIAAGTFIALSSPAEAVRPLARATLHDASGAEVGEVTFKGAGKYATRVEVDIQAPDVLNSGGFHGLHIHTTGVCDPTGSFASAGGHWPDGVASPNHAGDLPSVLLTPEGNGYAEFESARFKIDDLFDSDGSAVVLHTGADNFANIPPRYTNSLGNPGPDDATLKTGDAGTRYACGVVERLH